jgi:hypothetical protein
MSRRGNDSSVLLSDIEDSLRRVLTQVEIKMAPFTDKELEQHFKRVDEHFSAKRQGKDRVVEGWIHELTPQGVRELSLKTALHSHASALEYSGGFTDDDVLETARKYENFILGGFVGSELPKDDAPDGGDE